MQATFIRIELFCANKLDRIWMNLAQIGQIWRVSLGFHTFADMTTIGIIEAGGENSTRINDFTVPGFIVKLQVK